MLVLKKRKENLLQLTSCKSTIITQLLTFLSYIKARGSHETGSERIQNSSYYTTKMGKYSFLRVLFFIRDCYENRGENYILLHVRYESGCRPANFKMVSILKKTGAEQKDQIWKFNEASRWIRIDFRFMKKRVFVRPGKHWNPCIAAESRVAIINNN